MRIEIKVDEGGYIDAQRVPGGGKHCLNVHEALGHVQRWLDAEVSRIKQEKRKRDDADSISVVKQLKELISRLES